MENDLASRTVGALRKAALRIGALGLVGVTSSILLFLTLELAPSLIVAARLWPIEYYAIRGRYQPDPMLVLRSRLRNVTIQSSSRGGLYLEQFGLEPPEIRQLRTFDDRGLRTTTASPPYDVISIGDSFLGAADSEDDTLSDWLGRLSGHSVLNLSLGFYGPYQYLELLREYGLAERPRYAVMYFFAGNDISDIQQYERWRREGLYHFFYDLSARPLSSRYWIAVRDTATFLRRTVRQRVESWQPPNHGTHPKLGILRLRDREIGLAFAYWSERKSAAELLEAKEWKTLSSLLADFKRITGNRGIVPAVVYIPTKAQIYSEYIDSRSGANVLRHQPQELRFRGSSAEALAQITQELGLRLVDISPLFRKLAARGELLYYRFDSHWNSAGRRAAAEEIGRTLARVDVSASRPASR